MRFFSHHLIFQSPPDAVSTHSSNQFADYFPAPAHNESVRGPQTSSSFRIVDNASGTSTLDSLTNVIPSAVEGSGVAFGSPGADESTQKSGPQNVPEGQYENSPGCNPGFAAHKRPRRPVGTPRNPPLQLSLSLCDNGETHCKELFRHCRRASFALCPGRKPNQCSRGACFEQ